MNSYAKTPQSSPKIINSQKVFELLSPIISSTSEEFWAIALTSNKKVIATKRIFKGTVDHCLFHPRDVLRFVIVANASSFIVAHNHPSQDPLPSFEDIKLTKQLSKLSQILQIPLLDHVILTQTDYISLLDSRLVSF